MGRDVILDEGRKVIDENKEKERGEEGALWDPAVDVDTGTIREDGNVLLDEGTEEAGKLRREGGIAEFLEKFGVGDRVEGFAEVFGHHKGGGGGLLDQKTNEKPQFGATAARLEPKLLLVQKRVGFEPGLEAAEEDGFEKFEDDGKECDWAVVGRVCERACLEQQDHTGLGPLFWVGDVVLEEMGEMCGKGCVGG